MLKIYAAIIPACAMVAMASPAHADEYTYKVNLDGIYGEQNIRILPGSGRVLLTSEERDYPTAIEFTDYSVQDFKGGNPPQSGYYRFANFKGVYYDENGVKHQVEHGKLDAIIGFNIDKNNDITVNLPGVKNDAQQNKGTQYRSFSGKVSSYTAPSSSSTSTTTSSSTSSTSSTSSSTSSTSSSTSSTSSSTSSTSSSTTGGSTSSASTSGIVPAPGAWGLFGLVGFGMAALRRRKRKTL